MATKINLLPWRETYRKEKNGEFFVVLGLCAAVAAGIGFGGFKYAEDKVNFQKKRNDRLNQEIAMLQEELEEIKNLEETKRNLLARMEIINELQGQRPQIVHTFHQIATRIPDGVFLNSMKQNADDIMVLEGRAESNARVSALMRTMDRSEYFTSPRLDVIEANQNEGISSFKITVKQVAPKAEGTSEDGI
ncbi:MAG: PilN domain-containing protein [Granulosicoccus sp.]|nr:PilN domain-containing protein [Granulosicoccus sp.]